MAHVALYREFRPQSFGDVVGQEHVTRTLRNALLQKRLNHAYLLSGPRGTGKTSVARILAKAVNCKNADNGEPCNACEACRGITAGQTMDVIEIDAASNRNIDDVRDLRDKVKYAPTDLTYKVYIIDEVHMLTEYAFNALLKTLEEPPGHTLFILATTDPQKVPVTITSRCQRFDFHRLAGGVILSQLRTVCGKYGLIATDEALGAIARQAEGGMRDALSLLDQVMSFAETGAEITIGDTLTVLGAAPLEQFLRLDAMVLQGDVGGALLLLDELVQQGKDLRQFVRDLLAHLRDLLILRVDASGSVLDLPHQSMEQLRVQSAEFGKERLLAAIKALAQLEADLRFAASPRLLVEVALIQICKEDGEAVKTVDSPVRQRPAGRPEAGPAAAPAPQAAKARLPDPKAVGSTVSETVAAPHVDAGSQTPGRPPQEPEAPAKPVGAATERVVQVWPEVLDLIKQKQRSTRALLDHAKVGAVMGNTVLLATSAAFVSLINGDQHKILIEKALVKVGLPHMEVRAVGENDPILNLGDGSEVSATKETSEPDDLASQAREMFGKDLVKVIKEDDTQ